MKITVVVRNGYADTSRTMFRRVGDLFSSNGTLLRQRMRRLVPVDTVTLISTPADFVSHDGGG